MFSKILIIIEYIFVGLVISVGISLPYYLIVAENAHNHEEYIEIVDKYITYGRYGNPYYYIVYRFVDGCIEEVPVSSTEYYTVKEWLYGK